jgi:hypothetical protein
VEFFVDPENRAQTGQATGYRRNVPVVLTKGAQGKDGSKAKTGSLCRSPIATFAAKRKHKTVICGGRCAKGIRPTYKIA